jgi:hypothetical protein
MAARFESYNTVRSLKEHNSKPISFATCPDLMLDFSSDKPLFHLKF